MGNPTPYAWVDLSPMPESTLSPSQGLWIWPLKFVFPVPGVAIFSQYFARKKQGGKISFFSVWVQQSFSLKLNTFAVCSQSHQSGVSSRGSSHFYFEKT
jgi:hypothetical protein